MIGKPGGSELGTGVVVSLIQKKAEPFASVSAKVTNKLEVLKSG